MKNFTGKALNLAQTSGFLVADREIIVSLLSDSELNVRNEIEVFEALLEWLLYNQQERCTQIGDVTKECLRKEHLDTAQVLSCIERKSQENDISIGTNLSLCKFFKSLKSEFFTPLLLARSRTSHREKIACFFVTKSFNQSWFLTQVLYSLGGNRDDLR